MTLAKWEDQLQKLLVANGFEPRGMYEGEFLPARALAKAETETKKFKERRTLEKPKA